MSRVEFKKGDLITYRKDPDSKNPSFMLWHKIQPNDMPALDWHPHRWSQDDIAIILDQSKDKFLKILKAGGGVGWVLAVWCKK